MPQAVVVKFGAQNNFKKYLWIYNKLQNASSCLNLAGIHLIKRFRIRKIFRPGMNAFAAS